MGSEMKSEIDFEEDEKGCEEKTGYEEEFDEDDSEYSVIESILDKIYKDDAMILKPAEYFEIDRCNRDMFEMGYPALPSEYVDLLMIANGFAWQGIEFFGTYTATNTETGFVLNDIVHENHDVRQRKAPSDTIFIIGTEDEFYFIFDYKDLKYKTIDKLTLLEAEEYESLDDLIEKNIRV